MRHGFTLIEILVSVMLISLVVAGILEIRSRQTDMADYIARRAKEELSATLFLKKEFLPYNREEKDAYTLLRDMGIKKLQTREVLKKERGKLFISAPLPLGELPVSLEVRAFTIRRDTSSTHYRIFY
jgi:prepilin-type N-terminal cleavage/methylation domain-containing protein